MYAHQEPEKKLFEECGKIRLFPKQTNADDKRLKDAIIAELKVCFNMI